MNRFLTAFVFCAFLLFFAASGFAQGEINVRIGNVSGASIFTGCTYYLGVFRVVDPQTVTLVIQNQSPTETLTLGGPPSNVFNVAELNVTMPRNTCGVTIPPLGSCEVDIRLSAVISGVLENTVNINSSDADEPLYSIKISMTALDNTMFDRKLILNEVSQGTSANREFVEFLVVGRPGICQDVRGWLFDDNTGRPGGPGVCGSTQGIAPGHGRLDSIPQWEFAPVGSLIVIYNQDEVDRPPMPANDLTDTNNDRAYIIPISDNSVINKHPLCPRSTPPAQCNNFNCPSDVNWLAWSILGMANTGDMFQLIDRDDLTNFHHSISWGSLTGTGSTIYFTGSASGRTFQFTNASSDDAFLQANWENLPAASQSPGVGNGTRNERWIQSLRFTTFGCVNNKASTPHPNDSCVIFLSTNATENVTRYNWDFDNDGTTDAFTTVPYTNYKFLTNGTYNIGLNLETTTPGCAQTQIVSVECFTFGKLEEQFRLSYNYSGQYANLNWATNHPNIEKFYVERSFTGTDFQTIAEIQPKTTGNSDVRYYHFQDKSLPLYADKVFYRIQYKEEHTGTLRALPIRELTLAGVSELTLAPNPAEEAVTVAGPEPLRQVVLTDGLGRTVFHKEIHTENNEYHSTYYLNLGTVPAGVYQLSVLGASGKWYFHKLVKRQ